MAVNESPAPRQTAESASVVRAELRRRARALRDGLPADVRAAEDAAIFTALTTSEHWLRARSVFMYCSVGSEADTLRAARAALSAGKALYMPRCTAPGAMEAVRVLALDALKPGKYGIPEPDGAATARCDDWLVIAPGLAFDRSGNRLGYGGGYYDRFLAGFGGVKIGLAYNCQLEDELPAQPHDVPLSALITPEGIIDCRA